MLWGRVGEERLLCQNCDFSPDNKTPLLPYCSHVNMFAAQ